MILAVENKQILGVAQLKYHEMKIFPDKKHWLGGVYVPEKYRDKKVGQKLTKKIENITKSLGVRTLNLQT